MMSLNFRRNQVSNFEETFFELFVYVWWGGGRVVKCKYVSDYD